MRPACGTPARASTNSSRRPASGAGWARSSGLPHRRVDDKLEEIERARRRTDLVQLPLANRPQASPTLTRAPAGYAQSVAGEVIHMSLEEFERGFVGPPTPDDVSVTADGRRLDSRDAVLLVGRGGTGDRGRGGRQTGPCGLTAPEAPDLPRIADTLSRHRVEYLFVGGIAARAHGARRVTYDADCVPRPSGDNLDRLAAALRELNARRAGGRPHRRGGRLTRSLNSSRPCGGRGDRTRRGPRRPCSRWRRLR
jgi:hypothetical protein